MKRVQKLNGRVNNQKEQEMAKNAKEKSRLGVNKRARHQLGVNLLGLKEDESLPQRSVEQFRLTAKRASAKRGRDRRQRAPVTPAEHFVAYKARNFRP